MATLIPAPPVENQDPWFVARDAFDQAVRTRLNDELSDSAINTTIQAFVAPRNTLNILDFGVVTGTAASQTAAIKAALDANPGRAFYFPPGSYRLDTGLVISASNTIILDADARIYAGAPMTTMITYLRSASGYAQDKGLVGGMLDGNLMADRILSVAKVIRFTMELTTFKDGIRRGLVTESGLGAEIIASNLRFFNSGTTNVSDNIAIEANMGDSHFRDIIILDWTTAIKDTRGNRWDRIHPWISQDGAFGANQMSARYPTSIGFDITGSSDLQACVTDTYRYAYKFRTNGTSYTAPARLLNCRAMWANDPILTNAQATANPAYVFDNADGVGFISDRFTMTGHSTVPAHYLTGPPTNITARNTFSYGFVLGAQGTTGDPFDYRNGVQQGAIGFSPSILGSTVAGSPTYSTRTARMVSSGETITYYFSITATLDNTIGGNLRLGGFIIPDGATNFRTGTGGIGFSSGVDAVSIVNFAGTTLNPTPLKRDASGYSIEIPTAPLRGTVVQMHGSLTVSAFRA